MTEHSTGSHPHPPELADKPHHDLPPPALHHDAFAHQLSPSNPPFSPNPPRVAPRRSSDFRHSSSRDGMTGANGNGPMAVPGGPHGRMGNGHAHAHGATNMREMGFGGPRSPPNNKSRSPVLVHIRCAHVDCHRHLPRALQILPPGYLPGWQGLSVPALQRAADGARALQVLHQGKAAGSSSIGLADTARETASSVRNAPSPTYFPTVMLSTVTTSRPAPVLLAA
jgi:hypothetical protein